MAYSEKSIHSFYKNFLSTYYVSGMVIGGRDTAVSKSPTYGELPFQCGKEKRNEQGK